MFLSSPRWIQSRHSNATSLRSIPYYSPIYALVFKSVILLRFPHQRTVCISLFQMHAACLYHLTLLNLITRIIFISHSIFINCTIKEPYCNYSLCSFEKWVIKSEVSRETYKWKRMAPTWRSTTESAYTSHRKSWNTQNTQYDKDTNIW
jgi:hypothetical protein